MTPPAATCQYVDVALVLQQAIRDRETASGGGGGASIAIGDACGKASIGSVDRGGSRRHFCADHVLIEQISRA
jgi:hypothetical protein